jgi:capsular polysaccharide biosynthesis protein
MPQPLSLNAILEMLWRQRTVMQVAAAVAVILTVLYMHVSSPRYTVSIQLVPAPSTNSGLGGSLGALGSLVGAHSSESMESIQVYIAGLQSPAVAEVLAKNQPLMHRLFPESWSERDHAWHQPHSVAHSVYQAIKDVLGIPSEPWQPPGADDVYRFLQYSVDVSTTRDSPVVVVSMKSANRQLASEFLSALTKGVDDMMRARALRRANAYIDYLSKELSRVSVTEYRSSLVEHLSDEEKQKMMASATTVSFVADTFSGPAASTKPTSPSLVAALIAMLAICLVIGTGVAFYLDSKDRILVFRPVRQFRVIAVKPKDRFNKSLRKVERPSD